MGRQIRGLFILLGILVSEAVLINSMQIFLLVRCGKWENTRTNQIQLKEIITADMRCFPVPLAYRQEVAYEDSYGAARGSGGHEGCDIMDKENQAGRIPIVSATDGKITNLGWLYMGGYRIGITSPNNIYYYYAHLDSYASGITAGKEVKAGELLGFMGSTGEGEERTEGKFPVHLHFGIYVQNGDGNEEAVNSYPYLQNIGRE
ncbi:MAG: M23 family metallopeptidase [Bacteroidales bacterium]|nr:M23 family metallopeptidase [Clostridium sp.]MCM1203021.1 M23 family metallopeptidase [Bacteroidales bacterium]